MANFCKYCGKPIVGDSCDCPGAVAEAQAKAQVQQAMNAAPQPGQVPPRPGQVPPQPGQVPPQPGQVPPQYGQAPYGQPQYGQAPAQPLVSPQMQTVLGEVKDLALGIFRAPERTLQQAAAAPVKTAQYILLGIASVVILFLISFMSPVKGIGYGTMFKFAFICTLITVGVRLVYGIAAGLAVRKQNPSVTIPTAIGVFSVTLVYDAAICLLLLIFIKISLWELVIAFLLFWLVASVICAYLATDVLALKKSGTVFITSLVIQLVLMVVLVFVIRGIGASMLGDLLEDAAGSLMGSMW